MSQRLGRKPFTTDHVNSLAGSSRAKDRLRVILETLRGELTIPDACSLLGIREAQFHHLRHMWLQEAVELLEPRRVGRPRKQHDVGELTRQCAQLQSEVQSLRAQVQGAQVREEIAEILANPMVEPGKKNAQKETIPSKPR